MTTIFIIFLNIFFILLIFYQIFLANNIIEGLENECSDPMIMAQKNAGNIKILQDQIKEVLGLNKQVQDISGNITTLTEQVDGIVQAQADYASENLPSEPPEITGT